jgi:hypothetical protein
MNAAFAIGRLCDMEEGRKRLLQLAESERMVRFNVLFLVIFIFLIISGHLVKALVIVDGLVH